MFRLNTTPEPSLFSASSRFKSYLNVCLFFLLQVDRKSTAKVDYLKEVEAQIQKRWADNKTFETDSAPVRMILL